MEGPLIILGSFFMVLGSYAVWPAKRNVLAHLQLGLFIVAYIIPIIFTSTLELFPPDLKSQYAYITSLGGLTFLAGIVFGFKIPIKFKLISLIDVFGSKINNMKFLENRLIYIVVGAILLLFTCFTLMGFVPAFSEDPFQAKFFRGDYREAYQPYAIPYRISFTVLTTSLAFVVAMYLYTKKRLFLILSIVIAISLSLTLNRGSIVAGLLLAGGCFVALHKKWFWPYFLFVVFIFPLGSASYYILGLVTNNSTYLQLYDNSSIWNIIADGAPDVPDQLNFLNSFNNFGEFTYGRTFLGGLVPSNFAWNPSVWTLYIVNNGQADLNNVTSGGLRLSVALWGYTSFGWLGVVLLPMLSGIIWGMSTRYIKNISYKFGNDPMSLVIIVMMYNTLYKTIAEFYVLSMYSLISLGFILYLIFGRYINFRGKSIVSGSVIYDNKK